MLGSRLNVELTLAVSLSPAEFDGFTACQKLSTIIVRWEARAVREESLTCNSVAVLRVPTCMYHVRLWTPYSQWRKRIAVKNIMYVHVEG
jgi:hypothetical protein